MRRGGTAFTATAAVALAATLSGCGGHGDSHGSKATVSTVKIPDGAAYNGADVVFVQGMIPHHAQAVEMADLAPDRTTAPGLLSLAAEIKAAQGPEMTQMRGWLTQWGQPEMDADMDHSGHGGMKGMMSKDDMGNLAKAKGAEFDRMFATMMIEHHQGAVDMANVVIAGGKSPEVRQLAQQIITTQQREITELQAIANAPRS